MAGWNTVIEKLDNGMLYVSSGKRYNEDKFWVAKILGLDPKFTFLREFINDAGGALLESGYVYEVKRDVGFKRPENYFIKVEDDSYSILSKKEVLNLF